MRGNWLENDRRIGGRLFGSKRTHTCGRLTKGMVKEEQWPTGRLLVPVSGYTPPTATAWRVNKRCPLGVGPMFHPNLVQHIVQLAQIQPRRTRGLRGVSHLPFFGLCNPGFHAFIEPHVCSLIEWGAKLVQWCLTRVPSLGSFGWPPLWSNVRGSSQLGPADLWTGRQVPARNGGGEERNGRTNEWNQSEVDHILVLWMTVSIRTRN